MKNENNTIMNNRLSDDELDQVNGGMKIAILKHKQIISNILRIIFRTKKKQKN